MLILALLPVVIWAVLLFGRHGFFRVRPVSSAGLPKHVPAPSIAVIIPARDEAEHIGQTVSALRKQDYSGVVEIFVVDDNSADETAAVAADAGATVIPGQPLPAGWTGKLWALSQGINAAQRVDPDFFLFTDADITHDANSLSELVAIAEGGSYDLTSFMVKLACTTFAEHALIPAFVFFFLMLYPPASQKTVGAAGGCMLIRPAALQKIGGIAAIRQEVIDDCALAKAIKKSGGRVYMGLTEVRRSSRSYLTFGEIGRMISRTAFNQLHHSAILLIATLAGLIACYVLPVLLLFSFHPLYALLGALAWVLMAVAYFPMVRFYKLQPRWSLALPFIAVFYAGATLHSAIQYWTGRGGTWKGRAQDPFR